MMPEPTSNSSCRLVEENRLINQVPRPMGQAPLFTTFDGRGCDLVPQQVGDGTGESIVGE